MRGQPIIVVQTVTSSACAIAASYEAKRLGITTGTLLHEAKQICPAVIPVQARHRLYTEYHERMLAAVDTCVLIDKVMSIDEVACRLMGDQRQVPVARALALKLKRALRLPMSVRSSSFSRSRPSGRRLTSRRAGTRRRPIRSQSCASTRRPASAPST